MLTWHLNVNDNIWKIDDIQCSHVEQGIFLLKFLFIFEK